MSLGTLVLLAGIFLVAILYCLFKAIIENMRATVANSQSIEQMLKIIKQLSEAADMTGTHNKAILEMGNIIEQIPNFAEVVTSHDKQLKELTVIIFELRAHFDKTNGVTTCDQRTT